MTTANETQRIYVASLMDYNAGRPHGVHIDLDGKDVDDVHAEIQAMLAKSPEAATEFSRRYGMVAEEFAIHDYEGFLGYRLGEYASIETVLKIAGFLAEHGEAGAAFLANGSVDEHALDADELEEAFSDSYVGCFDSEEAYAREWVADTGGFGGASAEAIEALDSYLRWDHIAHELLMDGWSHRDGGDVHVFRW